MDNYENHYDMSCAIAAIRRPVGNLKKMKTYHEFVCSALSQGWTSTGSFLREKQTLHHGFSMFQFWMVPGTKAMRRALSWASLGCRCHRCPTYRCRRCHESLVSCQVLRPRGRCSSVIVGDKIVAGGWGDFGPTWPNFQRAQDETSFQPESNSLELFLAIICCCHCH